MQKSITGYSKLILKLLVILTVYASQCIVFAQNNDADSLLLLIKSDKPDTTKVNHLNALCRLLMYNNPDSAITICNEAINTLNSQPNKIKNESATIFMLAKTYNNLGNCYYVKSNYIKAAEVYNKALSLNKSIKYSKGVAINLLNIGSIYHSKGDYNNALDNCLKALTIQEEIGDKNGISINLGNIGNIYSAQGNQETALEYYSKSLKFAKELGDKHQITYALYTIGLIYQEQKNFEKAFDTLFIALKLAETLNDKTLIGSLLGEIGVTYYTQGDSIKSLDYFLKALRISEEQKNEVNTANWLLSIGDNYIKFKNYKLAFEYLYRGLAICQKIGSKKGVENEYYFLSQLYEKSTVSLADTIGGKYLNPEQMRLRAIYYYEKYLQAKEDIFGADKKKEFVETGLVYDFQKKEAIAKLENEKQIALVEEKARKQKVINAVIIIGVLLMVLLVVFIFRSLKITRKQKQIIEQKSKETELQKHIIEEKNKDITDSINYAKRIQNALLGQEDYISKHLPEHFILFMPKDIVSGDFYWGAEKNGYWYFTATDCTGHGVPGAIMSMLGISFLNDIVLSEQELSPAEILNQLRERIITELRQADATVGNKDGMDISLCRLNLKTLELEWAGANNALNLIRNGVLEEIKADKQPIGYHTEMKPFTNHQIQLQKGDSIYIYSDGYADQFGGPKGKKFKYKQLEELIVECHHLNATEQKQVFKNRFMEWKGALEQVDDVCLFGVKV
jgi:serine phosphatase RsbU (regulator of sigma subunit)/Tfp pilus assembly protein PilF